MKLVIWHGSRINIWHVFDRRKNVEHKKSRINTFREISLEVYRLWKNIYIFGEEGKKLSYIKKFSKKKKKIRLKDSFSLEGTLSMKQQPRWGMQKVTLNTAAWNLVLCVFCHVCWYHGSSDGRKRGQKVTTERERPSYLAIRHRQVCLILKRRVRSRSFRV